jgi:hypothetical protein
MCAMPKITFRMGDAFPADDPIARWVMVLSLALGDLRIVATYAVRERQPENERMYFVRIFSSHLREIVKLLVLDYRHREDVREFVGRLPQDAQDARAEVERLTESTHVLRSDVTLFEDLKRILDDTFHYARDRASDERLRQTMSDVAHMEGGPASGGPRRSWTDAHQVRRPSLRAREFRGPAAVPGRGRPWRR